MFNPATGSIIIPGSLDAPSSPLIDFFKPDSNYPTSRRVYQTGDYTELRGRNYFISKDKRKSAQEKFEIIQRDLIDGVNLLSRIKREEINNPQEYLLYLGVMDYVKMHAQTVFHALTYNERYGVTIEDPTKLKEYLAMKQQANNLMCHYTRMYYQTLFGVDTDPQINPEQSADIIKKLVNFALKEGERAASKGIGKPFHRFKYPEVNHPLVIALGAQEAALKHPESEVLIGIPTGGTESAIVTQLIYEKLLSKTPGLLFIPLSFHSEIKSGKTRAFSFEQIDEYYNRLSNLIYKYYKNEIIRKKVLLIDDNSASGQTLEIMTRALHDSLAEVAVHITEYDGRRLLPIPNAKVAPDSYFDPTASPTTMGLTQVGLDNRHAYLDEVNKILET